MNRHPMFNGVKIPAVQTVEVRDSLGSLHWGRNAVSSKRVSSIQGLINKYCFLCCWEDWRWLEGLPGWPQSSVPLENMRLKGVEAKRKLALAMARRLPKTAEREHLEGEWMDREWGLREERERFQSAFANAPIGMALIDMDGCWLQLNNALCRITGYSEGELRATTLRALTHPDDINLDVPLLRQLLDGQIPNYQVEKRCRHARGHFVWMLVTVSLVRDDKGRALYVITQFQDISERKELARRLEYLVDHDSLTGLYNRRHFELELARELKRAARYGASGAVLLIDLDNFKDVNEVFGHIVGDDLLKGIAGLLRHRMRHTDSIARVGGDEFAVLLPQTDADQARVVADELVRALGGQAAVLADQSIRITASVGVALFDNHSEADQLAYADLAMYEAKQAGRNRFAVYRPVKGGTHLGSARLIEAERIRQLIEQDRLLLYSQPILDLKTNEVGQYELLLRLPGIDGCEPLPPSSFLYVAERFGLILAIDSWVVGEAIRLIAAHARAGRRLVLNVNLSGKSLGDPKLVGVVEDALVEGGIDPACLVFEFTEAAAIANLEQAKAFADRLRSHGCQVALDDFGAGFGSFYYLKNFPFDYLKIDGEFIRSLGASSVDQLVVQAIVSIARGMGKKTVAEFVGDAAAVRLLRKSGVNYAQGYHIGTPRPVAEVLPVESQNSADVQAPRMKGSDRENFILGHSHPSTALESR